MVIFMQALSSKWHLKMSLTMWKIYCQNTELVDLKKLRAEKFVGNTNDHELCIGT